MPKMTDKQKADLKKHMDGYKGDDKKAHRMRMMVRMLKGMSVKKAHADIGKSTFAKKNKGKKNAKNPIDIELVRQAIAAYNGERNPPQQIRMIANQRQGAGLPVDIIRNGQNVERYLVTNASLIANQQEPLPVVPLIRQQILNEALDLAENANNNNNNNANN
jgi:hypothetical protein